MRCLKPARKFNRWRRSQIAATALLTIGLLAIGSVTTAASATETSETLADRSLVLLPELAALDGRARQAFEARSLADLQAIYAKLQADTAAGEQRLDEGKIVTGCDVALSSLLPIVGFAINRIDGQGRYRDWMRGEGQRLLQSYHASIQDCATDAGSPPIVPQLTAQHVKAY